MAGWLTVYLCECLSVWMNDRLTDSAAPARAPRARVVLMPWKRQGRVVQGYLAHKKHPPPPGPPCDPQYSPVGS